jgi:mannosyltransferase
MHHTVERHPSADFSARSSSATAQISQRHLLPGLALIVLAGAALRFSTLDLQSFWGDETLTVARVNSGLGHMLSQLPSREGTPPLYFVVAWLWSHVFGAGEVGLRSLSALLGVVTIPVVYTAGRLLCSQKVGLVAAVLFAVNPLMVHYGQEARSYALVILLAALSLVFFARALANPTARALAGWAITSALAIATHYFAGFMVGAEFVWLLAAHRRCRPLWLSGGVVAAVGLALLPLAIAQASSGGDGDWIRLVPFRTRLAQLPKQFLIGPDGPLEALTGAVSLILVAAGVALVVFRGNARERDAARLGTMLALITVAGPLALSVAGIDFFTARNVIVAWLPAMIVVASGFGARAAGRLSAALLAALLAVWLFVIGAVFTDQRYQRDNWRGALEALGPVRAARAIVLAPDQFPEAAAAYRPRARRFTEAAARVEEVDLLTLGAREPGSDVAVPRLPSAPQLDGFRVVQRERTKTYVLLRLRARSPLGARRHDLRGLAIGSGSPLLLLEFPPSRRP